MHKPKPVLFAIGVMLLTLSAVLCYHAILDLSALTPSTSYQDQGVYTFSPYRVAPVQVQNTSATRRDRYLRPTKTVYMVYYRDTRGHGYQWRDKAVSRRMGQETVDAGVTVERRVLTIPARNTYITVDAHQTAETYTIHLKLKYIITLTISMLYITFYLLFWIRRIKNNANAAAV